MPPPTIPTSPPPANQKPFTLALIGGGLGSLCLAIALSEHPHPRIPFTIYEAAPSFFEIGAGVGLGPNALRAMALLSPRVLGAYRACETREVSVAEQGRFFNFRYGMKGRGRGEEGGKREGGGEEGELIADVRSGGAVTSSVHRARLMAGLVALLPEGVARCGKKCVSIVVEEGEGEGEEGEGGGVLLRFADGTEARHDAVIGCDGIKSIVRRTLLGEDHPANKAVFTGKCCYRGLAPAEKAIDILGAESAMESQMYVGHHAHVLTTPLEKGKAINVVAYCTKADGRWDDDEQWIKPTTKEEMLAHFQGWSKPVMDILSLIEKPNIWALFDHPPAPTYHYKGKICLLGDAAHASTPHHGAGAGMAVEDALILSKLLASIETEGELQHAFAAYDKVRRPRSQRLVASSRKMALVYDFEDEGTRHSIDAMGEFLLHAWDWIWNEDVEGQVEKAQKCLVREARRD